MNHRQVHIELVNKYLDESLDKINDIGAENIDKEHRSIEVLSRIKAIKNSLSG